MKIQSVKINHYKSLETPFNLEEAGHIHIFIGPNNAGKTNILDAINIFAVADEKHTYFVDSKANIEISIKLESEAHELKLKEGEAIKLIKNGHETKFLATDHEIDLATAKNFFKKHLIRICATKPIPADKLTKDYEELLTEYPRAFEIFRKTIQDYFPEIKLNPVFMEKVVIEEYGTERPFERLGAGFQQVFIMLMYLFHPAYHILLIEEPEIHLHPAMQKKLVTVFESKNLNNQIFFTTHSPVFIHPENLHRVFRVIREKEGTKVYSPRVFGKMIDYKRLVQELNADNCEIFLADKVLIVEGVSDRILMRGLIDRFYKGGKEVKVIYVFGKTNVDVYVYLLEMFNIPYAVMLDKDALVGVTAKIILDKLVGQENLFVQEKIEYLKKCNIFILTQGRLEWNYPRKYQKIRKHKPLNALLAASQITPEEYQSDLMKDLRGVIESL